MGLVLTRCVGESVVIGHDIVVTVVRKRGDQIGIHIDAPKDVEVWRSELLDEDEAA